MRRIILAIQMFIFSTFVFAMPEGRWWVPECNSSDHDHEYEEGYFELCYEETYEQPMFVSYQLTKEQMNASKLKRSDNFKEDSRISTGSATLADYKSSGYSRGHLAKRGDFAWDKAAQDSTYLMSNMSPQEQNYFNGGIWLKAEDAVSSLGKKHDYTYVVTGPILDKTNFKTIGSSKVAVPEDFYKIAVFVDNEKIVGSFAVIMSQTNKLASSAKSLSWDDKRFIVSIKDVEARTGIDFFKLLDDKVESYLENYKYGEKFTVQDLKLDSSKVIKNSTYKKAETKISTTAKEDIKTPTTDASKNMANAASSDQLVDKTFLTTKLSTRMYLVNIAKNSKLPVENVLYSIGYYGLESKIVNYTLERGNKITYEDKTSPKTLSEGVKEGNVTVSDKDADMSMSIDDYAIKAAYENKEATVDELAEVYDMTLESMYIKLGTLKAKF